MFDVNKDFITDDLDMLSEILNPVEEKTLKFEEGENRVVSILFLDVKGFTAMSESLSSEDVKRTMDKILTAFSNSIIKYGGYIDKYEGDLIMALFGSKITSETDTERAINAGLKILSDLKHINKILNIDLKVRIGINTGEVTTGKVGMKRESDFTVYGDAVNLASRMESNAPLNTIMLPKDAKEIVEDHFIFENLGDIEVKGKEKPISVYKVLSKNPKKVERWERNRSIIKKSTYVGREKEVNSIIDLYNTSKKEIGSADKDYKPIIIGLRGPAGIGKSRLVKEFIDKIDRSKTILSGYTKSYAQPAYCIWSTMLKNYFNIEDDDPKEKIIKKLNSSFENLIDVANARQELLEARNVIGYIFGVKYEDIRLEKIGSQTLQTLINISIRYTIEAISFKVNKDSNQPLVIYFDDCQWIDEASQNLLKNFIESINTEEKRESRPNKNLLFLLTYRPEFKVFKEFELHSRFSEFELTPLTINNSKKLVDSMLGENNIQKHFIEIIMKNSAGNPFYIEELVNYLIEKEKIIRKNDIWIISGDVENIQIPLSLNSIILSRIDNLNNEFKNVLQKASVIGHHFFKTILKKVSNEIDNIDIDESFKKLVNDKWFYSEQDEDKYFFKHTLTSDVCYNAILRYNKRILHKVIAEITEKVFQDNKEYFAFIANHYEKSDPKKGTKEFEKMLEYLEKAGDHAKYNYENENAIRLYTSLITNYELSNVKYIDINLKRASILELTGKWNEAEKIYKESLEKAEIIVDNKYIAKCYTCLGLISWKRGDYSQAMGFYEKQLNICKEMEDKVGISTAVGNMGIIHMEQGNYTKAMECYEMKINVCKDIGDKKSLSIAVGNMGVVYEIKGNFTKAMECYQYDLQICEEMENKLGLSVAIGNVGCIYKSTGEFAKAKECFEKQLEICEELGDKSGVSYAIGNMGNIFENKGNYSKAMKCFEQQLQICEDLGDKEGISIVVKSIGNIYIEKGEYAKAIKCYDRSILIGKELNIKFYLCSYLYYKALALFKLNDSKANSVNLKALKISLEIDREDIAFNSNILNEKISFKFSNDIQSRFQNIENLNNMLKNEKEEEEEEDIAELNYEITLMLNELKENHSEYKNRAIGLYKKLYKKTPKIEYKNRYEKLEKL